MQQSTTSFVNLKNQIQQQFDSGKQNLDSLLEKFLNLQCPSHKIRNFDHVLTNTKVTNNVLFCSICIRQDEKTVHNFKKDFVQLQKYLPKKINQLSGSKNKQLVKQLFSQLDDLRGRTTQKTTNILKQIEQDFKEIQSNVIAFCQAIKKDLSLKVEIFGQERQALLTRLFNDLSQNSRILQRDSDSIMNDFEQNLSTNFDFTENAQVNGFVKRVINQVNRFTSQQGILLNREALQQYQYDLVRNPYYNQDLVAHTQEQVYRALQEPLKNGSFLDFNILQIQKIPDKGSDLREVYSRDDKKAAVGADNAFEKATISDQFLLTTDHKLNINSVSIIDHNSFATSANELKVKIWGFTQNHVIHERSAITLKDLCVFLKYYRETKQLLCALSSSIIQAYDLSDVHHPQPSREFTGHQKIVRSIALLPDYNGFFSCGYDETVRVWNFDQTTPIISYKHNTDSRTLDCNKGFVALGSKAGTIKTFRIQYNANLKKTVNGRQEIFGASSSSSSKEISIVGLDPCSDWKADKERITAIVLSQSELSYVFSGSELGTVSKWNLENGENLLKVYNLHRGAVCSIDLFQRLPAQENGHLTKYMAATCGWDGNFNLYDFDNKKVVSNTKYQLQNDEKQHFNYEGLRVFSTSAVDFYGIAIGNDDKRVQGVNLKF